VPDPQAVFCVAHALVTQSLQAFGAAASVAAPSAAEESSVPESAAVHELTGVAQIDMQLPHSPKVSQLERAKYCVWPLGWAL
jgi:hypothetical protein